MRVLSLFDGMSCARFVLDKLNIPVTQYIASEVDKWAIQIAQKNFPDTIQMGDVRGVRQLAEVGALGEIDLLIGGSPCFVAGTKIVTDTGYKNIEDVRIGCKVLSHLGTWDVVLDTGGEKEETYILKTQGVIDTKTTAEHPYYVRKSCKVWNNQKRMYERAFTEPEWVKASNLGKGDFCALPILKTSHDPFNLTDEECYIIGRYIADGHTRKDYRNSENRPNDRHWQVVLSVGSHKIPELKRNHSLFKHTKSTHRILISSKRLVEIVENHCGVGAENKYISQTLLDLPVTKLTKILEGLMDGDGYVVDERYRLTTVSESLIRSMTLAVAKCYKTGCSLNYFERPPTTVIEGRIVNQKNTWAVAFHKYHKKQSNYWVDDNFIWLPVKSVQKTGQVEQVYNLEVKNSNSYTANNLVVHNCQNLSFAGKQNGFSVDIHTLDEYKKLVAEGFEFKGQSYLFWEYVWIKELLQPKWWLLENVRMKKEYLKIFNDVMGIEGVFINSALVSAQNRQRYYWCNWQVDQPEDRGLLLRDVLESGAVDREKSYCIDANYYKGGSVENYKKKKRRQLVAPLSVSNVNPSGGGMNGNVWSDDAKSPTLTTNKGEGVKVTTCKLAGYASDIKGHDAIRRVYSAEGKSPTLTAMSGGSTEPKVTFTQSEKRLSDHEPLTYRKLTPIECERLQGLPDRYTEGVSNTQRYRMLGNGWQCDTIIHIFLQGIMRGELL